MGSSWDPAWGAAGLNGAPNTAEPQYAADISTVGVTALVAPPGGSSPYDFGTYTVEGTTLTLSSDHRETVICLTIEENGALTVKSCKNEIFGLKTGDRFELLSQ